MSVYRLKSVLELRRREEEAAAAHAADATRERAAAEAEETRLAGETSAARALWENARAGSAGGPDATVSGAAAGERSRFVARRRDEFTRARAELAAFRSGRLAEARAAEATARDLHLAARQAREAFDKHEAKFQLGQRTIAQRREEETLEDVSRAARQTRGDNRS